MSYNGKNVFQGSKTQFIGFDSKNFVSGYFHNIFVNHSVETVNIW